MTKKRENRIEIRLSDNEKVMLAEVTNHHMMDNHSDAIRWLIKEAHQHESGMLNTHLTTSNPTMSTPLNLSGDEGEGDSDG